MNGPVAAPMLLGQSQKAAPDPAAVTSKKISIAGWIGGTTGAVRRFACSMAGVPILGQRRDHRRGQYRSHPDNSQFELGAPTSRPPTLPALPDW